MGASTMRTARLQPGGIGITKRASNNSYCVTAHSPAQVYELLKSQFIAGHPDCLQHDYEAACRRFARKAGL